MAKPTLPGSAIIGLAIVAGTSFAQTPALLASAYESVARVELPNFAGFSATRGKELFRSTHGSGWSCASCHTDDPRASGRHVKTGKAIAPLAPSVNPDRFTSADKVEKWFRRNCNDVLGRPCAVQEKGDVLAYLMSLRP